MTVSPPNLNFTQTSIADLSEVASGSSIEDAGEQFEGVFLSLLLKEMRKTVGDGVFGGDSTDTIGGLFDLTLGQELGRSGGLGISESLLRYQRSGNQGGQTHGVSGVTQ